MLHAPVTHTHILLVDDNPDNLRLLARMLEAQGYRVRKSLSGKMALQAAQREPPDLILLDINMPEMNGYEVCQQLKAEGSTQQIPVIFISALDQLRDKIQAFEMGGLDYITKPFQEQEVLARVRNQLLIQSQRQQLIDQNQQLQQEISERQRAEAIIRDLNTSLEEKVQSRTLELQKALNFEATLKRISDKVRDSLNQHHILQTAVEELAQALEVHCCDAVLYSPDRLTSIIRYQYVQTGLPATQGQMLYMEDAPELYEQLQQQQHFALCQVQVTPIRNHSAILACPIFDDQVEQQGTLGDLWLFKPTDAVFSEMEIHLVQQVANQCAIALRQARLYEASQLQVKELQRLNQLKDDFLSTVSHELRTPIASIKLTLQILMGLTNHGKTFLQEISHSESENNKIYQYFSVLQEECDRELYLIQDLLSLQQLEAGMHSQQATTIRMQDWIPHMMESFQLRTEQQQQQLSVIVANDLPPATVDITSLSRILTELLNNACKYTPAGETISLVVEVVESETFTAQAEGFGSRERFLKFSVSNTGVTIPAEEMPRIFDKFYRIPNNDPWKYGGTGLGLALVQKLVEGLNGTIQVESNHHVTCFSVQIPIYRECIYPNAFEVGNCSE